MPLNGNETSTKIDEFKDIEWLNPEFFHDVIKQSFENFIIKSFKTKHALQPGENYLSNMIRINIIIELPGGKIESVSYVAKAILEDSSFTKNVKIFTKEIDVYSKIVPMFEDIFKKFGRDVRFTPKCLKVFKSPDGFLMEDLKKKNFVNMNRFEGLDKYHIENVLIKLAHYHAISAYVYGKEKNIDKIYHEGLISPVELKKLKLLENNFLKIHLECTKEWKLLPEHRIKYEQALENYFSKCMNAVKINWDNFNVLTHGDLWSNNIMFQHDDNGNILETYFVDFQLSKWGSPIEDIFYFLMSSCNSNIKIKEFDNFIKFYHEKLVESLKFLQYSKTIPTIENLMNEHKLRSFHGIQSTVGILSAALLDPDPDATFENYFNETEEGNNFKRRVFLNPRYVKEMETLIPFFYSRGYLDL